MPGTFVAIGLKRPRTFSGAFGFMSQRSVWLGAPQLKIKMTDFAFAWPLTACVSLARHQLAQNRSRAPRPAVCKNCRRVPRPISCGFGVMVASLGEPAQ